MILSELFFTQIHTTAPTFHKASWQLQHIPRYFYASLLSLDNLLLTAYVRLFLIYQKKLVFYFLFKLKHVHTKQQE